MVKLRWMAVVWFIVCAELADAADALIGPERVLWNQKPIALRLQVDQERLVRFEQDVAIWLSDELIARLRVESVGGVVYFKALQSFPAQRIRIQEKETNLTYLFDVQAVKEVTASHDLLIVTQATVEQQAQLALIESQKVRTTEDWYIRLTRHAVQQLYAPERLSPIDRQITSVLVDNKTPVALVDTDHVQAVPVAAWRGGGFFVTAVRLRNLSPYPVCLDLDRDVRGDWLALTLQHSVMQPAGSLEDSTSLYLVSKRPFGESL